MPRQVIVEGPDGAGKSTLIRRLSTSLGRKGIHTGGANHTVKDLEARCAFVERMSEPVIFDRCSHISDGIYKEAMGIPFLVRPDDLRERLLGLDPIIVFCRLQTTEDMFSRISTEGKGHKPPEFLKQVRQDFIRVVTLYDQAMDLLSRKGAVIFRYNWQLDNYDDLVEKILCAV